MIELQPRGLFLNRQPDSFSLGNIDDFILRESGHFSSLDRQEYPVPHVRRGQALHAWGFGLSRGQCSHRINLYGTRRWCLKLDLPFQS